MRNTLYIEEKARIEVIISRLYALYYNRSNIKELFLLLSLINLHDYKLKRYIRFVETLLISLTMII